MAILLPFVVAMILAGVRPRFVAITVKLFSALLDGSTVIRTQGLSEWIRAWAFNKAAWALAAAASAAVSA